MMIKGEKQSQAITKVSQAIIKENLIDAIFLKGSIARGEDDEYSDVDLYCIVSSNNYDTFLNRRLSYLQSYKPILHTQNVDFVGPQIICIYEDGLHFDLYTITFDKINHYDQIKVLYDPNNILEEYKTQYLQLQPEEVGDLINEFSFTLIEYYQAYHRKDEIFALRLAHYLFGFYTELIRYFIEPNKARIGVKGFKNITNYPNYKKYLEVLKNLHYQTSIIAVQLMVIEVDNLVLQLPVKIAEYLNIDFFLFSKNLIFRIKDV